MDNDCLYTGPGLLRQVADGCEQAFSQLVKEYSAIVYTHALTYLKNAALAEEVAQDVFMKVWRNRGALPSIHNFKAYLFVIVKNTVISEFRKKTITANECSDDIALKDPDPADSLEARQLSELLAKAMNKLPPRRQQVFKMSRIEGKTYEEIAHELGISKSSVNQHIVEALLFLRTYLRNEAAFILLLSLPVLS